MSALRKIADGYGTSADFICDTESSIHTLLYNDGNIFFIWLVFLIITCESSSHSSSRGLSRTACSTSLTVMGRRGRCAGPPRARRRSPACPRRWPPAQTSLCTPPRTDSSCSPGRSGLCLLSGPLIRSMRPPGCPAEVNDADQLVPVELIIK